MTQISEEALHKFATEREVNVLIEEGIAIEPAVSWLVRVVERTLVAENVPPNSEVSLVISGQERLQELNRDYRGKDRPTDVLAFSMSEQKTEEPPFVTAPDQVLHLGEVLISYPQAVIQAEEHRHPVKKELAILIIHGVLHLLGYDHEKADMKRKMQARETEILSQMAKELA